MASLEAIQKTNIVRVPQPIKVIDLPGGGAMFAMEYLKMKHLNKYVHVSLFTVFWGSFFLMSYSQPGNFMSRVALFSQRQSFCLLRSVFLCVHIKKKVYMYVYMCVHTPCPCFAFPALEMAVITHLCAAPCVLGCCCSECNHNRVWLLGLSWDFALEFLFPAQQVSLTLQAA